MPDKKLPILEFAAKLKAKYPEYRNIEDTVLVQRVTEKYPQYKETVDLSGISKKKEVSEVASGVGGKAGISGLPSGLTPRTDVVEFKEPKLSGEDTALARRIQRQQQQAIASTGVKLPAAPKVVAEEKAAARAAEPKLPASTIQEGQSYISNVVSALDRGFYSNLVENPIRGLATVIQQGTSAMTGGRAKEGPVSDFLNTIADKFGNAIREVTPQDKEFQGSLSDQFTQALGQVGALVVTGGAGAGGRAATLAEQAIPKAVTAVPKTLAGKVAAKAAPTAEGIKKLAKEIASPASISAGLTVGQAEFDRAKEKGASDQQAFEAFYKNAAVGSILEKIPVMQFLNRFNKATSGGVVNYLKTKGVAGITGGLEEATTEVLQQLYANKTAQDIYNINQNVFEGITESGGIGFGVGFLLNAMGAQAKLLRQQGKEEEAQTIENQEQEFKAKAEGVPPANVPPAPPAAAPVVEEEVVETEVAPQVPEAPKQKYRVEYFDPTKGEMTHSFFDTREEGDRFTSSLTEQQKSKGIQAYFQETTEPSMKLGEEVVPEVPAAPKVEPIRQLGTGSNVYFENDRYRVNDYKDKTLLNVQGTGDTGVIANLEFNTPEEAVFVAKTLNSLYPQGVPEAVLLDKVVEDIKAGKYKEQVIGEELTPQVPAAPVEAEVVSIDEKETIRQMKPFTDEMANIEREFENRGFKIDTDYDNEIIVTDRQGNILDPEEIPADIADLAAAYEQATMKLGEFDQVAREKALEESRKVEEVVGEEVVPEVPAAPVEEGFRPLEGFEGFEVEEGVTPIQAKQISRMKDKAMSLESTNPRTIVMQYFINGGKINKSAIQELYGISEGAARIRLKRGVPTEEMKVKKSLLNDKAPGLEALSESFAERLMQFSETQVDNRDFVDAIAEVLQEFNSVRPMIQELASEYDQQQYSGVTQGDLKDLEAAVTAELEEVVAGLPQTVKTELLQFLDKYRTVEGFVDWAKVEEVSNDFDPDYLSLSEETAKAIKDEIQRNVYGQRISRPVIEDTKKAGDAARRLAERIRQGKISKLGGFRAGTGFDAIWDASLEVIAKALEGGASVADAIEQGLKYAKSTGWYKKLTNPADFDKKYREQLNEEYNAIQVGGPEEVPVGEAPGGRKEVESGVPPTKSKKPAEEGEAEGEKGERRFTKRMIESPFEKAVKKGVSATLEYTKQTNAMSVAQAQEILDVLGEDKAYNVLKDEQTNGAVRVVLGQVLIKRYNELAKKATTKEDKDLYIEATIDIAEYVTTKLATDAGQTIQAFKLWEQLTPEAQVLAAVKQIKKSARRNIDKVRKDIDNLGEKFNKANEDAVKEILKSEEVDQSVKKDTQERINKAKDKAAKARQKRADIINKYKGKGGITLTTGGLTKEGIEFVGEVALTYIEEGLAEVQAIAEKIFADIKTITGSSPNDTVKAEVLDIAEKTLAKSDIEIVKSVKDQKLKINEIAIKHFTEAEKIKKGLAQKFVEEADMSESNAEALAKRFEDAFDRVVSRKKAEILAKEKKRFDRIQKAVNEQAGKKAEKKTLQDEIIKYSNLGAFNSNEMLDLLSKKFDLGQLTTEQAAKIQQLAEKIQKAPEGSPKMEATEDLLAYQADLNKGNWGEVAQGIWYANILSGYRTHEKNIISTFFNSLADLGAEVIADPKGAPYLIAGYMRGVGKIGLLEALRTLKTGRSPIHVRAVEIPDILERKQFIGGGYNPANWFKYVGRAMKAEDILSFQGLKEARAWQLARREAEKYGFNTWSKSGWKKVNELLLNTSERYEIASSQAESEGLKPNTKQWKRRIYELMESSRPEAMTEDAYNFAAHGTYNYNSDGFLGAVTNAISKVLDIKIGGVQPGRFVVPFTRIITNVVNNALDYSPVGIIRAAKGARGFKSFEEFSLTKGAYKPLTPEQRRVVSIKAAVGISFAAIIQYMVSEGLIDLSGGGPEDEKKKAQLKEQGWEPYSIKIGDKWYSYFYTPLVLTLGWMGNLNDAAKYGKEDEKTLLRRASIASLKFGGMLADMTWINSASTFLGAFVEPKIGEQQKRVENALSGMARGFVPFAQNVTQLTQAYNSTFQIPAKQVNNSWEALYQDIPIARNSLNDKINALGEPVIKDIDIMWSKEKGDPIWSYLTNKQGWVAPLNRKTVLIFDENLKQDRPLTDDEFYKLSKLRGSLIKKDIERIMKEGYPVLRNGAISIVAGEDLTSAELNNILSRRVEPLATKKAKAEIFGEGYSEMEKDEMKKELSELEREYWGLVD